MSAPDYVTQAAELLGQHGLLRTERFGMEPDGWYCDGCAVLVAERQSTKTANQAISQHRAEVLAAAGLIPTSTEWGVRHPVLGPEASTIEPEHRALYGDHWTILTRAVTDWKDATDD